MKPWDDETDMAKLEECVRSIQADGLVWGSSKLVPVGYGIKKFQIQCVVEDDKLGTDMLESRSLLLTSMYSLGTWLHSTRSKIHHGSVPLNKRLKDKKKNWLEPTQLKMAEDLTSSGPWDSLYIHYNSWHTHQCHDSSEANHESPKSGRWPNSWKSPTY